MRRIYLVRHAKPDTGPGKRSVCLGRTDAPLSLEGEKQAERLAPFFKKKKLSAIYTSPLARCAKTAEILRMKSHHIDLPVIQVEAFSEVDAGIWDGLEFDTIKEMYPLEWEERNQSLGRFVIPQGESLELAGRRFMEAFQQLNRTSAQTDASSDTMFPPERDILIVAHSGVLQVFLCLLTGKDVDWLWDFYLPYASVTSLVQKALGTLPQLEYFGLIPECCLPSTD